MGKLVVIDISKELALEVLTTGYRIEGNVECIDGLPEGARLISAGLGAWGDIRLTIELPGEPSADRALPCITPTYQRTYPETAGT